MQHLALPRIDGNVRAVGLPVAAEQQKIEWLETRYPPRPLRIGPELAGAPGWQLDAEMRQDGISITLAVCATGELVATTGDLRAVVADSAKPGRQCRQQVVHFYPALIASSLGCIIFSDSQMHKAAMPAASAANRKAWAP